MSIWIIFIISLVVATIIANGAQRLYMKMMGASAMFFSGKKKLIAIGIIALILSACTITLFGIEIPNASSSRQVSNQLDAEEIETSVDTNQFSSKPAINAGDDGSETERQNESAEISNRAQNAEGYITDNFSLKASSGPLAYTSPDFSEGRIFLELGVGEIKAEMSMEETWEAFTSRNDVEKILPWAINYDGRGDRRAVVIDTHGKIIWESPQSHNDFVLYNPSEFKDGLAYFVLNDLMNDHSRPGLYMIIDSNGNISFSRDSSDFRILGHGDGIFLVAEHVANFSTNEWLFGAIDKDGNYISEPKLYAGLKVLEYEGSLGESAEYLGEGVFRFNPGLLDGIHAPLLLNIKMQKVIYDPTDVNELELFYSDQLLTGFENGHAFVAVGTDEKYKPGIYKVGTDGVPAEKIGEYWNKVRNAEFSDGLAFIDDGLSDGGLAFLHDGTGAYYNMIGEKVIDFPEYHGKNNYACDPFYNGYASMRLQGADGLTYHTLIDKKGEFMFDPITGIDVSHTSHDGKYFITMKQENSPEFNKEKMEIDINIFNISGKRLSNIFYERYGAINNFYNVYDDVIKLDAGFGYSDTFVYVNVLDGTIIGAMPVLIDEKFSVTVIDDTTEDVDAIAHSDETTAVIADDDEDDQGYEIDEGNTTHDNFETFILQGKERYYNYDELQAFSKDEVALVRNGMYALSGLIFDKATNKDYFSSKYWYTPIAQNVDSQMNDYQKQNAVLCAQYEKDMGWR